VGAAVHGRDGRIQSKMTTSNKMPKSPCPLSAAEVERAARADPDDQPRSESDFKGMKRTPQAKIIRRALDLTRE
jgi:hypothetical protein